MTLYTDEDFERIGRESRQTQAMAGAVVAVMILIVVAWFIAVCHSMLESIQ